jgi:hypothetical protein
VTLLLSLLRRYWLHLAVLATAAVLGVWFYSWAHGNGVNEERGKWLAKENAVLAVVNAQLLNAQTQRDKAQARVDALSKLPAKVIERVRTNPSNCDLPKPVADGLREQVAEINRAIREQNGRVPGNSGAARR